METMRQRGGEIQARRGGKPMAHRVAAWARVAALVAILGLGGARHARAAEPKAPEPAAPDTGEVAPGDTSADATTESLASGWKYRFDMTAPQNEKFGVTDRNFYLYFRPDTAAVKFQVQNRRGVAARILWDECTFTDTDGHTSRALHRGIPYDRRDAPQAPTWVQPNQTYSDFLVPVELLLDPSAATGGQMRELLPTDVRARSLVGKVFGCRLVIEYVNDNLKTTYDCQFKILSTFHD